MTTPAFVSAGPRIRSGSAGSIDVHYCNTAYTASASMTDPAYAALPSGLRIAVLTGATGGVYLANGTTTPTLVRLWSDSPALTEGAILTAQVWRSVPGAGVISGFTPPHKWAWDTTTSQWGLSAIPTSPASLTIPELAAPAGIADGDKVIIILATAGQQSSGHYVSWAGFDDWELMASASVNPLGIAYRHRMYGRVYTPGCLPLTITPTHSGSPPTSSNLFYYAQLFSWTPSYEWSGDFGFDNANAGEASLPSGNTTIPANMAGMAMSFASQPWASTIATMPGMSFDRGFVEIHHEPARAPDAPLWHGGDLHLTTRDIILPVDFTSGFFGPTWIHPKNSGVGGIGSAAVPGVAVVTALQRPPGSTGVIIGQGGQMPLLVGSGVGVVAGT